MRAVRVEESPAIGAKFLDGLLRGYGTLRNDLLRYRLCCGFAVRAGNLYGLRLG